MITHKIETRINYNGVLNIDALPFIKGDDVEVIIFKRNYQQLKKGSKRTIGEYADKIHMTEDFSEPLPDNFWLGDDE